MPIVLKCRNGELICCDHPRYMAKRRPQMTLRYPEGCESCWEVWRQKQAKRALDIALESRSKES